MLPVTFRSSLESDLGFIYDSWLKEYRLSMFARLVESEVYYPNYRKRVGKILEQSQITVMCNPQDEDQIYGYAVHRDVGGVKVLSWIFIKGTYRKMGLGKMLWEHIGKADVCTHISRMFKPEYSAEVDRYVVPLPQGVVYNPFLDWRLEV